MFVMDPLVFKGVVPQSSEADKVVTGPLKSCCHF